MSKIDFDKQINECINKNLDVVNSDKWRNKYHIMAPIALMDYVNLMENIIVIINTHH